MYYRNANCAVVVYDITQPVSRANNAVLSARSAYPERHSRR
jgi:hypothetical protein